MLQLVRLSCWCLQHLAQPWPLLIHLPHQLECHCLCRCRWNHSRHHRRQVLQLRCPAVLLHHRPLLCCWPHLLAAVLDLEGYRL
jgi:hypothetical protein